VEECTRKDAILDLVIADEPDAVHDVIDVGTFPGSDHQALTFSLCFLCCFSLQLSPSVL